MSFLFILIAWVGHGHLMRLIQKTSNRFTYANGLLMLSIVLVPFVTAAVAEYLNLDNPGLAQPAVTLYCAVILLNNISWNLIQYLLLLDPSLLKPNVNVEKGKQQLRFTIYGFVLYAVIMAVSFWFPVAAFIIIAFSNIGWLIQGVAIKEENMTT